MATTTNITPVATLQASVNNNSTVTVPDGVTPSHLGIAVFVSANLYSTGSIPNIVGWTPRVSNPAVANNMEWTVMSRFGGHSAGDVITVTQNKTTQFDLYVIWYDTAGLDINQISTPAGRGTSNSQYTAITGLTANATGQTAIVVATERSTPTGTNITSWSGTYTPGADNFAESATNVYSSNFFGHFLINSSTSTGTLTANYNMSSGNGAGVIFTLGIPTTGSFQDPFTTGNWNSVDSPPGNWWSSYGDTTAPMGGGEWKLPLASDYMWYYPYGQVFLFNMSTMAIQVRMDAVGSETFSMRLTTDGIPEQGNSFVSVGISTGGKLYMNQRTSDPNNGSTDDVFTSNVTVAVGQPVVLRLRHGGGATVYGEYSYDYVNWTTFASKTVTCFNPTTDLVTPMFQAGSPADEWTNYAHISNMNTGRFTPYNAPWRATTQWTYWNGTKEVEVPPGPGFSLEGTWYFGPRVVGTATNAEVASGSTVTCPVPANVKAGEYLIVAVAQSTGLSNVATPVGWTYLDGYLTGPSSTDIGFGVFYKVATNSEPANYTFSVAGNGPATVQMVRVANANGTSFGDHIYPPPFSTMAAFQTDTTGPAALSTLALSVVVVKGGSTATITPPATDTLVANSTGTGIKMLMSWERRPQAGNPGLGRVWLSGSGSYFWIGSRIFYTGKESVIFPAN